MKQSIVEVIAYLLESAISQPEVVNESNIDHLTVRNKLEQAGFTRDIVGKTFDWLRELIEQQRWYASVADNNNNNEYAYKTLRIFTPEEAARISVEARSFILSLEQACILDTKMREIAISQLLQLNQRVIELADAKWVVLLVLMSKANRNVQDIRGYLLATMATGV